MYLNLKESLTYFLLVFKKDYKKITKLLSFYTKDSKQPEKGIFIETHSTLKSNNFTRSKILLSDSSSPLIFFTLWIQNRIFVRYGREILGSNERPIHIVFAKEADNHFNSCKWQILILYIYPSISCNLGFSYCLLLSSSIQVLLAKPIGSRSNC